MKLIPWHFHDDVEAYTTTKELGDISLNNPNISSITKQTRTCFFIKYRFRTHGCTSSNPFHKP